jgi:peroxiredoxin Q/BCP
MLEPKQAAPDFLSPNQDNQPISLADFRGRQNVILYFYPKDDTPGCTTEAKQFTALADEFAAADTVVLGVSKDDCDSHKSFISKYGLNVQLLADGSGELCEKYGVWQMKEKDGVKKPGIVRSTFLINKQGLLEDVIYGVKPEGHAQAMLDKVKGL